MIVLNYNHSVCYDYEGSSSSAAMMSIDDKESTKVVLEVVAVAQSNGLKLPREFGLLLKQAQYTNHCYIVLEIFITQF